MTLFARGDFDSAIDLFRSVRDESDSRSFDPNAMALIEAGVYTNEFGVTDLLELLPHMGSGPTGAENL